MPATAVRGCPMAGSGGDGIVWVVLATCRGVLLITPARRDAGGATLVERNALGFCSGAPTMMKISTTAKIKSVSIQIPFRRRVPGAARARWLDFPLSTAEGETLSGIFDALVVSGVKFDAGSREISRPRDVIRWILEQVGNDGKKTKTTPLSRKGAGTGAAR